MQWIRTHLHVCCNNLSINSFAAFDNSIIAANNCTHQVEMGMWCTEVMMVTRECEGTSKHRAARVTHGQAICHSSLNFVVLAIFGLISLHALVTVVLDFWLAFVNDPFIVYCHCMRRMVLLFSHVQ